MDDLQRKCRKISSPGVNDESVSILLLIARINLEFNSLLFYIPRDFAVRLPPHFGHGLERYFKMRIDLSMDPFF